MKRARFAATAGLCTLAVGTGLLVTYRARSQSVARVVRRPFTAQIVEKHFRPDGTLAPLPGGIDYIIVARKGDGSQLRLLPLYGPDGAYGLIRGIFDVTGKRVSLEPFTKSVSTYYFTPAHIANQVAALESCPPEAESPTAERSQRLGYEVVRLSEEHSSTRGLETDDRWVAPALGCFVLAETYKSPFGSRNETGVVSIIEGEPPDSWFATPGDYTERSPSQIASAYAGRFPDHEYMTAQGAAMADRSYNAHRGTQR